MKKKNINYPGWELFFFDKAKNFRNYQQRLIQKYIYGNVAEVGPGNGTNAQNYYKKVKKLYLFEPTKKLFNILKIKFKKKNVKIINKEFFLKKKYFNSIIYLDVIEHITNYESEINLAYKSLKKNGYLIINVPAFQFLFSQFDKDVMHVKRFNKKDFLNIFKKIKIKKHKMIYYDSIGFFLSLLSKIFSTNYRINFEKKIKIWDKFINLSQIIDKIIGYNCGKSLLVIIQKT